jgi:hypothetical protein
MSKILNSDFNQWCILQEQINEIDNKIHDRCDYIVKKLASLSGLQIKWWDFGNARENPEGNFEIHGNEVLITGDGSFFNNNNVALLDDGDWGLNSSFPSRWLFEDFEDEAKRGIADHREIKNKELERNKKKEYRESVKEKETLLKKLKKMPIDQLKKLTNQIK